MGWAGALLTINNYTIMKRRNEILEILGEDVVRFYDIKLFPDSNLLRFEVIVKHFNYCQIKMLINEILWIQPENNECLKIVFGEWQVND